MQTINQRLLDDDVIFGTPPDRAVLWYPGLPGGGTKIYDRSIKRANNGTITGALWTRLPSGLWVLDYDGTDDKVVVADTASLSFGNATTDTPFSIVTWINMDDATGFQICGKMDDTVREYYFLTDGSDKPLFACFDADNTHFIRALADSAITTSEGKWIQIAAVYTGSGSHTGLSININGANIATTNDTGISYTAMHNTATDLWIGGIKYGTPGYANGKNGIFTIVGSALSVAQLASMYNQTKHSFGV